MNHYLIHVKGCVEPEILGPYADERTRNLQARILHRKLGEHSDDAIFWLDIDEDGVPETGSFSAGFLRGAMPPVCPACGEPLVRRIVEGTGESLDETGVCTNKACPDHV